MPHIYRRNKDGSRGEYVGRSDKPVRNVVTGDLQPLTGPDESPTAGPHKTTKS